jgi:two-component system sensor histidine kinase PhoQ
LRLRSLGIRLLFGSALALPLFLGLTAYGLDRAFARALLSAELEQLKVQSYLLLGAAELEGGGLVVPPALPEPRYAQTGSGLYARLVSGEGQPVWTSPSADLIELPPPGAPVPQGECAFREVAAPGGTLHEYACGLVWEDVSGDEYPFQLKVWHHDEPYRAQIASYRGSLLRWMAPAAVMLIALQLVVLRFGLRPLRELAEDLVRVEEGAQRRLSDDYPDEVRGVTRNLNQLLASEEARRERYRNTLADLAHSLKTPLAVMRGALESAQDHSATQAQCEEQVDRMDEIVVHQLGRASSDGARALGGRASARRVADRLAAALHKVYRDKGTTIEVDLVESLGFRGEESDLMEMLGNLLDNACKYGRRRVVIAGSLERGRLVLEVSDDGPGVSVEQAERILRRGVRADETAPGQGIGLSVAFDIAESYGGSLNVAQSEGEGSCFILDLPGTSIRG